MKWRVTAEDLEMYKEKYGNEQAIAGYAEVTAGLIGPLGVGFYIIVLDDQALTLVELSMKLEEKNVEKIQRSVIQSVQLKGLSFMRKVIIQTTEQRLKLTVKSNILGIKQQQKAFLQALSTEFS